MSLVAALVAVMAAAIRHAPVSMKPAAYCQPVAVRGPLRRLTIPSNAAITGRKIRAIES